MKKKRRGFDPYEFEMDIGKANTVKFEIKKSEVSN